MRKKSLSEQLRPLNWDTFVGQKHILAETNIIKSSIRNGRPLSMLFWGPPGCGKTTLAQIYGKAFKETSFISFSATIHSITDVRKIIKESAETPLFARHQIIFIDEIHRFNKAQQDAFLQYVERGSITLIGATTENPSFTVNNALISRMRILEFEALSETDLSSIINNQSQRLSQEAHDYLIKLSHGDGRYLINMLENIQGLKSDKELVLNDIEPLLQKKMALHDAGGDLHYNLISALHKSIRGSDHDATLYWINRMMAAGEDPLYILRRLIRIASEDIGLADPQALSIVMNAQQAYQCLGSPEGELALSQAAVYLALAPKSNALYLAHKEANNLAKETFHLPPPKAILNAPTKVMEKLNYKKGYKYDHDFPHAFSGQNFFPENLDSHKFYHPVNRGFERDMSKRIEFFNKLRESLLKNSFHS